MGNGLTGQSREFVDETEKSFSWNMAEAVESGSDGGKIAMQINLLNRLAVTGTANG
jgi:hypothetical protein